MSDIALPWDSDFGAADFSVVAGDLLRDEGLYTAVLLSLFTDRRAEVGDAVEGSDRRGWWADEFNADPIGSRLWLLERSKREPTVLARAETYATEALAWLLEDGVAESVSVVAGWLDAPRIGYYLDVSVLRPKKDPVLYRFDRAWEGTP